MKSKNCKTCIHDPVCEWWRREECRSACSDYEDFYFPAEKGRWIADKEAIACAEGLAEFWDRVESPSPMTHEVIFSRYDSGFVQTTFVDGEKKEIWPYEKDWDRVQFSEDCDERDENCMRKYVLRVAVVCGFGKYDDVRMRDNSLAVTKQADIEGATLLWNNDDALPLAKTSKISLFGYSQRKYALTGWGSGRVQGATTRKDLKSTLAEKGFGINSKLANAYSSISGSYGYNVTQETAIDANYYEYDVREPSWSVINSTTVGDV